MDKKSLEKIPAAKKSRSCAYPMLSLPQAIAAAKSLHDSLGEGPFSRASVAKGMGYSSFSGAASGKIGSLVHFGLLERAGGMYSIALPTKAVFSYPEKGSLEAIAALAQKPVLYRRLFGRFLNHHLPEKLGAVLAADYGITQKAAATAAENFIATIEFAGLFRGGKIIVPDADAETASPASIGNYPKGEETGTDEAKITIKLASGIEISFPGYLAYRLSIGEFAPEIKNLDAKAGGV